MALKIMFGNLAADYITESGRDIARVAEAIGKTPANQFSKWKSGKWTYIAEKKLIRVIDEVAGKNRHWAVSLMIGYLIDLTPESFRHVIDITPKVGQQDTSATLSGQRWTPGLRKKLEEIGAAYARDDDFMRMVDQYGKWAETINRRAREKNVTLGRSGVAKI